MAKRLRRPPDHGAVAVEFAFIAPLFIMLIFGAVQYGMYFWQLQSASSASREGARLAIVGVNDCPTFVSVVKSRGTAANIQTVTLNWYSGVSSTPTTNPQAGDTAKVSVTWQPFRFGLPFVPFISGTQTAFGSARVESVGTVKTTCSG